MEMVFNPGEIEILAHRFKILSEPARLQILSILCQQEQTVQSICTYTGLLQSNVSKHLRLMKDAGIVECRRQGIWRYYRVIDPEIFTFYPHAKRSIESS